MVRGLIHQADPEWSVIEHTIIEHLLVPRFEDAQLLWLTRQEHEAEGKMGRISSMFRLEVDVVFNRCACRRLRRIPPHWGRIRIEHPRSRLESHHRSIR